MLPDIKAKGLTIGVILSTKIPFVGVVQLETDVDVQIGLQD